MCLLERERARGQEWEGERGRERESQADVALSTELMQGLIQDHEITSRAETRTLRQLHHPGARTEFIFNLD